MPARRIFEGQRGDFLRSKCEDYAKAKANRTAKDCTAVIQLELPLDVERTQEELDAVNDDVLLPERSDPESKKDTMAEEEYSQAVREFKQYQKDLSTRKRQIENRLKDDYEKAHATKMKGSDKKHLSDLLVELTIRKKKAQSKGKHRRDSAQQAWIANKDNHARVRQIFEQCKSKEKPKHNEVPNFYNKVVREEFAKLSQEEKQKWERRAKDKHKKEIELWKEKRDCKPLELPEDRQA
ncbi:hypothetical protein V5O48_011574 [Marasmius crinis-equi]|uniref:Uncharacterized protein n=1 Tax=Marasmius crinis-equi TaxID=585013 RepID=A0ABR3F598_9AGAR